jgi:hypothetical protein
MVNHQGTLEDAQWYSFGTNKDHGLRRTNEDKARAVKAALAHPNGAAKSDHQIAKHVGVDVKTVGNWHEKLTMGTSTVNPAHRFRSLATSESVSRTLPWEAVGALHWKRSQMQPRDVRNRSRRAIRTRPNRI